MRQGKPASASKEKKAKSVRVAQNGSNGQPPSTAPAPQVHLPKGPTEPAATDIPETAVSPSAVICSTGVLIANGTTISVYDCDVKDSAELRGTFEQHNAVVSDIQLHPLDADMVASVSIDGELFLWRPSNYTLTQRVAIAAEVFAMRLIARPTAGGKADLRAALVLRKAGKREVSLLLVNLTEKMKPWEICVCPTATPLFCTSATLLAVSKDSEEVLVFDPWKWQSHHDLLKFNDEKSRRHREFQHVTALACHPTRQEIALGLRGGQLRIFNKEDTKLVTMQHWHSKAILSLAYTSDGGLLYSGGEEAVLVAWNTRTWKRTTLPRISSPIIGLQLSPADSHILVKCQNNALHVVGLAQFAVECSLYTQANGSPRKLVPAANGCYGIISDAESLRFYDAKVSRVNCALTTTQLNTVVSADTESLPQIRITDVAYSAAGEWLATVEESSLTLQGHHLSTLKWWTTRSNRFEVVAEAYDVHQTVNALLFHPLREMLLTAGGDGLLKVWEARIVDDDDEEPAPEKGKKETKTKNFAVTWSCTATHPGTGATSALCFSRDTAHSALFMTKANAVAICRVDTFAELTRLRQEEDRSDLLQLHSLPDGRHLAARSNSNVFLWDVVQRSLIWCVHLAATRLISLPFRTSFAAVAQNRILEFDVESACPSYISDPLVSAKTRQQVVDVHVFSSARGHSYVYLTSAGQVSQFSPSLPSRVITSGEAPAVEQRTVTPKVAPQLMKTERQAIVVVKASAPCNFLTKADATHTIPALSSMLETFMRNYLTESPTA